MTTLIRTLHGMLRLIMLDGEWYEKPPECGIAEKSVLIELRLKIYRLIELSVDHLSY